jgi:hypothetical protein
VVVSIPNAVIDGNMRFAAIMLDELRAYILAKDGASRDHPKRMW